MGGRIAELARRGVVAVSGLDAEKFLNDLVTSDMPAAGKASYGALLTPQGKILFDFIAFRDGDRFLFDLPGTLVAGFVKRLGFYRLRAKVDIADLSDERIAVAAWGADAPPIVDGPVAADPRLAALGFRGIVPAGADMAPDFAEATEADYDRHRIALGVPEGGIDFAFGESYPHDVALDQLGGVDFRKGCYIGQEVVSRMEHRGTARRRIALVTAAGELPPVGTAITTSGKALGTLGSSSAGKGIAIARLDRVKEAMDTGISVEAGGVPLTVTLPQWAAYGWPDGPGDRD
jgi:folate-binding protein YgfZ